MAVDMPRRPFRLEPPPASRRRAKRAADARSQVDTRIPQLSSRNPFAALVAPDSVESVGSDASTPSSTGTGDSSTASSSSSASTPTQDSNEDDDIVVYDGSFVNPVHSSRGPPGLCLSTLDTSLQALGLCDEGDVSSAWEDELYSSLSEASPVESAFAPRIPRLSFQAPSPEQPRRSPRALAASPRRPRKATQPSPHHPFGCAGAAMPASPSRSPKRSPRRSSPRKTSPNDSPSRPRISSSSALSSLSSPALEAFQLDPTSPIQLRRSPPKLRPFGVPLPSLSTSLIRPRTSPLKLHSSNATTLDAKQARREAKRAARAEQDRAAAERANRSLDGIDLDELDRFFGITPKRGKASRGGYGGEGRRGGEREQRAWRDAEEFRGLLDGDDCEASGEEWTAVRASGDDDDLSGFDVCTRRGPPPPLFLHGSTPSRSYSFASSDGSLDDAASALDARVSLASPIDLSCTSVPSLCPSPFQSPSASPSSATPHGSVDSVSSQGSSRHRSARAPRLSRSCAVVGGE